MANEYIKNGNYVVANLFVLLKIQENFNPDFIIWVDTIKAGRFEDTNQLLKPPNLRSKSNNKRRREMV